MSNERQVPPEPDEFRLLEKEIRKHGHVYVQLQRTSSCALYAVQTQSGIALGYEVIRVKIAKATFMKITWAWVPERETYPTDEEFGERGWYFMHPIQKNKAESRYLKLCIDCGESN